MSSDKILSGATLASGKSEEGHNLFRQLTCRKYYRRYVPQPYSLRFFSIERTRNTTALQEKSRLRAQAYAVGSFTPIH